MAFSINGSSPQPEYEPQAWLTHFHYPQPRGWSGQGKPVAAVGKPWVEIGRDLISQTGLNWYNAFFSNDDDEYVDVTLVIYDPRAGQERTFSAVMLRPTWESQERNGYYRDFRVRFVELVAQ